MYTLDEIRTGWLSPSGEFFPCSSYEHIKKAREILNEHDAAVPDGELLNRGYAGISIMNVFDHGYAVYWRNRLTLAQRLFLRPYYEGEYGLPMIQSSKREFEYEIATT